MFTTGKPVPCCVWNDKFDSDNPITDIIVGFNINSYYKYIGLKSSYKNAQPNELYGWVPEENEIVLFTTDSDNSGKAWPGVVIDNKICSYGACVSLDYALKNDKVRHYKYENLYKFWATFLKEIK